MDTRKTTLIAIIAVIALLAVGIGYAYTAYTENSGNSTKTSYVTITQLGTGYKFANDVEIKMDTYNEKDTSTVYYKLNGSTTLTDSGTSNSYILKDLGTITLHAVITGTTAHPDLNISIAESTNFDASANWIYIIGSAPTAGVIDVYAIKNTEKTTPGWTTGDTLTMTYDTTESKYLDKELHVYYGYSSTNVITKAGQPFMKISEAPKDLKDASVILVANSADA